MTAPDSGDEDAPGERRPAPDPLAVAIDQAPSRRSVRFWEELWVYMWVASLIGTWWELVLSIVMVRLTGNQMWWRPVGPGTILHFAEPYGIGAAVVILVVLPLQRRRHLGPTAIFLVSALLSGVIEAASGALLVATLGDNPFWDFSNYPYDLAGLTSLASVIVFGLFATLFVFTVYPATAPLLHRMTQRHLSWLGVLMLLFYLVALVVKLRSLGLGV